MHATYEMLLVLVYVMVSYFDNEYSITLVVYGIP